MSDKSSDESLVDDVDTDDDALIPDDDSDIEDATEDVPEEDYDFLAFVQGVRPTRRAVTLYQNNDVRAQCDLLKEKIEVSKMAGRDTSEDEELLAEAAAEIIGSGRRVIVQARSSDWSKQFRKSQRAQGVDPFKDKVSDEARAMMMEKYLNALIAEHIVYPATGITAEAISVLGKNNEQEAEKLHQAVRSADGERGVSPDFLRAHSANSRSGSR